MEDIDLALGPSVADRGANVKVPKHPHQDTLVDCNPGWHHFVSDLLDTGNTVRGYQGVIESRSEAVVAEHQEKVTNIHGGCQSKLEHRLDLLPAESLLSVGRVVAEGAKEYGENNWRKITVAEHLNHARVHILKYQLGDESEDHLAHAACRMLFAIADLEVV